MTPENNNRPKRPGRALAVVGCAVAIVGAASLIPWEKITDGSVKDFDLVADLKPQTPPHSTDLPADASTDDVANAKNRANASGTSGSTAANTNADPSAQDSPAEVVTPAKVNNRIGELVVIEDYTQGQTGLKALKSKLSGGRQARIAVVGDSYIEGDIMTQDLRAKLQSAYGGSGVGYMNLHSDFPGFRRSVVQGGDGWTNYTASKRGKAPYMGLSEQYSVSKGNATATYRGTSKVKNADKWATSRALLIAPEGGTVKTRLSSDDEWTEHLLEGSDRVQMIESATPTSDFQIKITDPSIIALGVWLDGPGGVGVDCMSSRGIPGYSLTKVPVELAEQMRRFVNYDLIILEFGINVMAASQTNYSTFTKNMVNVVTHLRQCYPDAEILLMGVGDRGEKRSGAYHSMSTIGSMIEAQRKAAIESGALFWDTREAMGGEDAIVDWARDGRANKDYIHLTHKGGEALADQLYKAIKHSVDN